MRALPIPTVATPLSRDIKPELAKWVWKVALDTESSISIRTIFQSLCRSIFVVEQNEDCGEQGWISYPHPRKFLYECQGLKNAHHWEFIPSLAKLNWDDLCCLFFIIKIDRKFIPKIEAAKERSNIAFNEIATQ